MSSIGYYTMIKSKDKGFVFGVRLQMVRHALEYGIKATARVYGASKNTIKKWVRRYKRDGTKGIVEISRAPHHIPHKTKRDIEEEVLRQREKVPCFGAKRLKREFDIPCSHYAISRILKEHGKIKPRKRKKRVRNNLREIKDKFRAFEKNCIDTKHLYDIPYYWGQMRVLRLPRYQYTLRDMKLGAMFIGSWNAKRKSCFIKKIEEIGGEHYQIPKVTYNADVETVHNTIESEFYDIEVFKEREDFFAKATTYGLYYNLIRKNSNRRDKSPLDILEETGEDIDERVSTLPVLDLDMLLEYKLNKRYPQGGHDLPWMLLKPI